MTILFLIKAATQNGEVINGKEKNKQSINLKSKTPYYPPFPQYHAED